MTRAKLYLGLSAAFVLMVLAIAWSNAHAATTQTLKRRFQISTYKIHWYQGRGHWTLRPGFEKCRQLRFAQPRGRCYLNRVGYRWHRARLERIRLILWPSAPPARTFSSVGLPWPWNCIHDHEGAWDANTGNGYYGGFQMDVSFQMEFGAWAYARWGTANNWPPSVQYEVARQAPLSRWPTYVRYCT